MSNEFSLSELYEVFIKTTYPIEVGEKTLEAGETLCVFDKIQISNFHEIKNYIAAHGGYGDADRVFWENTKEIDITFSQGIFNHLQFALMCNARMVYKKEDEEILIPKREEVESDDDCVVTFGAAPVGKFFVYDKKTGEKVEYTSLENGKIKVEKPYLTVILDYNYVYNNGAQNVMLGNRLIEGFLQLEGKTRVKDDISGKTRTGIIRIPKLKLMSDLSMRLGKNANPVVANFRTKALPSGNRENTTVMDIIFLNDDIDSDM